MNNAKKNLLNGTAVYMIGNVLVMLLQLIMLKYITGNVHPEGYGYYNLIVTIDNLITPIITLQISDAVFRYMIRGGEKEKKSALSNGVLIILCGIVLIAFGTIIINNCFYKVESLPLVVLYVISTNVFALYQKMARSMGKNVSYVKSNLIKAFLYLLLQFFFIYTFHMEVESLFLAMILSTFISLILLEIDIKCRMLVRIKFLDFKLLRDMLKFSVPLIPNTILWWLSGSINTFVISGVIGLHANGVYTVSGKFASIISTIASVFNMSWQESAIREYGNEGSKKFYSEAFKILYNGVTSCIIGCLPLMYLLMPKMIDQSYKEALIYAPVLVVSAGVSALYGFFGQMYAATGKTKGAFTTTIFGVLANMAVLFSLIKLLGLWAACIGVLLSSISILAIRYSEFRKEMDLRISNGMIILLLLMCVMVAIYYCGGKIINFISVFVAVAIGITANFDIIKEIVSMIKSKMIRRLKK